MKNLKKILTKEFLLKEYITNKKSCNQIAKEIRCGKTSIENYLINHDIFRRKGCPNWNGTNNPKFRHGLTLKPNYCIDCDKEIDYRSKRCKVCSDIDKKGRMGIKGKLNPCYGRKVSKSTKRKMSLSHGGTGINQEDIECFCIDCLKKGIKTKIFHSTWFRGGKRCASCAVKQQHRDNIFNYNRSPNKPEKELTKLLKNVLPKEYKYVGNNKIMIDTFNPDFINCNGQKKIIELYGCYWHKCQDCGFGNKRKIDERRVKVYTRYGYKTLIIWEHELKDLNKVKNKIKEFNKTEVYNGCGR